MPFDELTPFLQEAAAAQELYRVPQEVSGEFEVAALTELVCREFQDRSPVLLFERLTGGSGRIVSNLLGNRRRFLQALGAESLPAAADRIVQSLWPAPARPEWRFSLGVAAANDRDRLAPRTVRRGLCQQLVKLEREIDLGELLCPTHFAGESSPALTSAVLVSNDDAGRPLLETASLEIVSRDQLRPHLAPGGAFLRRLSQARSAGQQLPVAAVIGGDPLLPYAGSLPVPSQLNPWLALGLLRNESVNLIRARTLEIDVPAEAELILEGVLDPEPATGTGRLADDTGLLRDRCDLPTISLTALTRRAQPLLPTRVLSHAFNESFVTAELTEQLLLRVLRWSHPDLADLHLPRCGGRRHSAFLSVRDDDPLRVQQLVHAFRSLPRWGPASLIVVVPADVNVRDSESVWRAACDALDQQPQRDFSSDATIIDAASRLPRPSRATTESGILDRIAAKMEKTGWRPGVAAVPVAARPS